MTQMPSATQIYADFKKGIIDKNEVNIILFTNLEYQII